MIILTIRTDKPVAEIGLYDGRQQLAYETWTAHRQLAETLHTKIRTMMTAQRKDMQDIQGVAVFQGPGSFTGLRIGLGVANALAYALGTPIIAQQNPKTATDGSETTNDADPAGGPTGVDNRWIDLAIDKLLAGETDKVAIPEYGAPVHITPPRQARD